MMLPVDEVDKNDRPNGRKVTIQQAHDQKLLHRCVAVFVFDKYGQLYVQVHKKSNGQLDHTVGGHVDAGEDYKTAAYREMNEEIGLVNVKLNEVALKLYSKGRHYLHMFGIYECVAPNSWQFVPNREVDQIFPLKIGTIVNEMNTSPKKFTGGFINTMFKFIAVKKLPLRLHRAEIIKTWD